MDEEPLPDGCPEKGELMILSLHYRPMSMCLLIALFFFLSFFSLKLAVLLSIVNARQPSTGNTTWSLTEAQTLLERGSTDNFCFLKVRSLTFQRLGYVGSFKIVGWSLFVVASNRR